MEQEKHTPGPWEVAHAGEGVRGGAFRITEYYVRLPDADFGIANDIVDADMKPSEANARLIAAAPDLLAALKAAISDLEDVLPTLHAAGWQIGNEAATIRRAQAAIAAATGSRND